MKFPVPDDDRLRQLPVMMICSWYGGVRWREYEAAHKFF
jgi:hypothetical protein